MKCVISVTPAKRDAAAESKANKIIIGGVIGAVILMVLLGALIGLTVAAFLL